MGGYHKIESEFIERTLRLLEQYHKLMNDFPFQEQYNYTLLINCLLGLVVMPKERILNYVPTERLLSDYRKELGLEHSQIHGDIKTLRDLIYELRNSAAHFSISVISLNEDFKIDEIVFEDIEQRREIIRFKSFELYPFLKNYAHILLSNYAKFGK